MITKLEIRIGDEFLKILHDNSFNVTVALIDVNAAQSKLVLLDNFNENYSKCGKVTTVGTKLLLLEEVTTASTKVTTVSTKLMLLVKNLRIRSIKVVSTIPNVDKYELRLYVFSKSLSGDAEKWWNSEGIATTWKELQFSIARTPQQNGVVERRNRTLIGAAKTMLADSKLPTTFWAEAVNTACYVQNRVLVVKPYNKTSYELFHGKFDGKADEDFLVGYSLNSKAFRVFNSRTRIVKENLHIRFSESTQSNGFVGTKASDNVDPKSSHDDGSKTSSDEGKKVDEDPRKDINFVGGKTSIELPDDTNMPALEDYSIFDFMRNDEDDGVVADMNNLDTTI
ncbi:ribonuclease H-like domain-containing protein [Tanacetum coccineum]